MKPIRKEWLIAVILGLAASPAMANPSNDRFLGMSGDTCARTDTDPLTNGNVKGARLSSTTASADAMGINYSTNASAVPTTCMRVGNISPAAGTPVRGAYVASDNTVRTNTATTTRTSTRY